LIIEIIFVVLGKFERISYNLTSNF
jgi:hypothetical protein